MRCSLAASLLVCLLAIAGDDVFAQDAWEYLGPGVGYKPEAFFVSPRAVYVGLAEQDGTGLGLYRYRFDSGEWDLFAWPGYNIFGITVWGPSDENMLVIRDRPGEHCYVLRSVNGGSTWIPTLDRYYRFSGLTQAPSDTSRVLMDDPTMYSLDAGWTWNASHLYLGGGSPIFARFDPTNPQVAYLTGEDMIEAWGCYKSMDAGATWRQSCWPCWIFGIDVERAQPNHVMAGNIGHNVTITTDGGDSWFTRAAPFGAKMVRSLPWWPGCFFVAGSDLAGTSFGVWRTSDLAESWFPCGAGLPTLPAGLYYTSIFLEGHPTEPTLYLALEGSGVWRWRLSGADAPDRENAGGIQLLLYPNPSSDQREYGVRLPAPAHVALRLFDANGRLLRVLQDGVFTAGTHRFNWRDDEGGGRLPVSGIYYLRLDAGEVHEERKIVVLK